MPRTTTHRILTNLFPHKTPERVIEEDRQNEKKSINVRLIAKP
jgi:hypothetical protein